MIYKVSVRTNNVACLAPDMQQRDSYLVMKDLNQMRPWHHVMHDDRKYPGKKNSTLLYIASVMVVFVND